MDWNKTDDGGVKLEDGWIVETERRLLQPRQGKQSKEE